MQGAANGVRQAVLETIKHMSKLHNGTLDFGMVSKAVVEKLSPQGRLDHSLGAAVLSYWNDLLRTGHIGFGVENGAEWDPSKFYVAGQGIKALEQADRDPINPGGYLAYLDAQCPLEPTARGYVAEALDTYRACCYKATAVLIGAAVEKLVLDLRDDLAARLTAKAMPLPKGLDAWQVKTALDAVAGFVLPELATVVKRGADESVRKLREDAESRLSPIAAEFRRLRNDAGHPAALEPVLPADVHSNLLLFPSTAKLLKRLKEWVTGYYV